MKTYKNLVFVFVTVLAILIQLTNPTLAYADDGAPTQPADPATEVKPPQEPAATEPPSQPVISATEAAPTEETVPTELATEVAPTELPVATEAPTVDAAPDDNADPSTVIPVIDEPTVTEVVQQIPADTSIVVVDETGEVVPLVTQEAAEIIASSDPVWCPADQKPGDAGCSSSYASLNDLLTGIGKSINSDGTIWITSGYVADTNLIWIDGLIYTDWANYALTLQGSWDGKLDGNGNLDTYIVQPEMPPYLVGSNFYVNIFITNWDNTVSLNGITVENNSQGTGLVVTTKGDINLKDVTVSGNDGGGAYLQNCELWQSPWGDSGCSGSGDVTLTGMNEFNFNGYDGLSVISNGTISLSNVAAYGNQQDGAILDNSTGTGNVTLTGTNFFNYNGVRGLYDGLAVYSNGNITLDNVTAEYNSRNGVYLFTPDDASINNSTIINNGTFGVDASSVCRKFSVDRATASQTGWSYNSPVPGEHTYSYEDPTSHETKTISINCKPKVYINGVLVGGVIGTIGSQLEFTLDCDNQSLYNVNLPNGDLVQIFCPVSGKALIKRLDNTMLPAYLPAGYTYSSAFSLDIFQNQEPIPVITEGGHIKASFHLPSLEAGTNYSILYWDNGTWIPLKEFMLDENGNPHSFELYPDDPRVILSGMNFDFNGASPRVEVSTNFPGIFVLAQH